ncbi:MAG: hypothetical protein MJ252_00310, partial [archaeon]|nr:hypothetical protein [archaeon]
SEDSDELQKKKRSSSRKKRKDSDESSDEEEPKEEKKPKPKKVTFQAGDSFANKGGSDSDSPSPMLNDIISGKNKNDPEIRSDKISFGAPLGEGSEVKSKRRKGKNESKSSDED